MFIKFDDNKNVNYSGSNCSPKGYCEFMKELLELIDEKIKTIKDKYNI